MARLDHRSDEARLYRKLYKDKRWRGPHGLRIRVLRRDGFKCQWRGCGTLLVGREPAPDSPVVHHLTDHKGNEALFWSEGNCIAVCRACHDGPIQASTYGPPPIGEDGWPVV